MVVLWWLLFWLCSKIGHALRRGFFFFCLGFVHDLYYFDVLFLQAPRGRGMLFFIGLWHGSIEESVRFKFTRHLFSARFSIFARLFLAGGPACCFSEVKRPTQVTNMPSPHPHIISPAVPLLSGGRRWRHRRVRGRRALLRVGRSADASVGGGFGDRAPNSSQGGDR